LWLWRRRYAAPQLQSERRIDAAADAGHAPLHIGFGDLADRRALMDLFLRKVIHPQAHDNYRVVVRDGDEIEIGSIGVQFDGWTWGIDTVIPMRDVDAQGDGKDRKDCMRQFRAAWDRFSSDPARLTEFLDVKRKRLR
jgi:hypothetical protein